jgi:hypothetical protein
MNRIKEELAMKSEGKAKIARRDLLRALGAGAGVAAAPAAFIAEAQADSESNSEKRKARYDPNSDEVKTYYRVNRY